MYDDLMHDLHNLLLSIHSAVLSGKIEQGGVLESLLYSLKENIEIILFLTDFQKKDFVREWCEKNKKETRRNIKMFRDLAEELDEFPTVHPTKSTGDKYDDLISNLSLAVPILDKMISDIKG